MENKDEAAEKNVRGDYPLLHDAPRCANVNGLVEWALSQDVNVVILAGKGGSGGTVFYSPSANDLESGMFVRFSARRE